MVARRAALERKARKVVGNGGVCQCEIVGLELNVGQSIDLVPSRAFVYHRNSRVEISVKVPFPEGTWPDEGLDGAPEKGRVLVEAGPVGISL